MQHLNIYRNILDQVRFRADRRIKPHAPPSITRTAN